LAVAVSLVVVMALMDGENLLKKQTNTKFFYCNSGSKNLSMHLRHHSTNSRQSSSAVINSQLHIWFGLFINKKVPFKAFTLTLWPWIQQ